MPYSPFTYGEMYVIMHFLGVMELSTSAVSEIFFLKLNPLSRKAQGTVSDTVREICLREQKEYHSTLRSSLGAWNKPALKAFLERTAKGLSDDERWSLIQIGDAEQGIINRVCTRYSSWLPHR